MALLHDLNHVKTGLKRLLSKESGSAVLRAWVKSYLARIQELEDTAWLVLESRTLEGEGAQLDAIGRLLLCGRNDATDDDYKIALRGQIRILRSKGRPRDLTEVARLSLPDGFDFAYSEAYPKTSLVDLLGEVDFDVDIFWRNLLRTKPGGTRLFLIFDLAPLGDEYLFAPADVEVDDEDQGDGKDNEDSGDGGLMSHVFGS